MELTAEFWLQIIIYIASLSAFSGSITARIKYLERKQDKHNNVLERIAKVEESASASHARLNELSEDLKRTEQLLRSYHNGRRDCD